MWMEIAHIAAKRATCMRLSVGAIMVKDRNIVSIGYNGSPAGAEHCLGNNCPGKFKCDRTDHAEANALTRAGSEAGPFDLYVTDSPCEACFDRIILDGRIKRIFFSTPYRINDHLAFDADRVAIYRITPSGYIMDWRTRELVEVAT